MTERTTTSGKTKPRAATDEKVFTFMVEQARLRDRLYFCSDQTAAAALGVSRHTILRARKRLESAGRIERCGTRRFGPRKEVVVYRFPKGVPRRVATQRSSTNCRTTTNPGWFSRDEQPHYVRLTRKPRRTWHRRHTWRQIMGEVIPINSDPPQKRGPTAGQSLFAAIVDEFAAAGVRLPRSVIAVAARKGAQALEDGVEAHVVLAGCVSAIRQGKHKYTTEIITDIALHHAGAYQNREDYRRALAQHKQDSDPVLQRMLGIMRNQRDAEKRPQIGRGSIT